MLFVVSAELQAVLQWLSTSWSVWLSWYLADSFLHHKCRFALSGRVSLTEFDSKSHHLVREGQHCLNAKICSKVIKLPHGLFLHCEASAGELKCPLHHPLFHPLFHPWFLATKTFQVCPGSYSITLTICRYGLKACLWAEASATVCYLLWQIKEAQNVIEGTALVHCSLNVVEMDGSWRPPL